MRQRLTILFVILLAGFSAIYILPRSYALQLSALPGGLGEPGRKYELPHLIGFWRGGPSRPASEQEASVLAPDTQFLKKSYLRVNSTILAPTPGPKASEMERRIAAALHEELEVSVVISGSDMGNSIHRPERCLVAQGYVITGEKIFNLMVRGRPLPVKRLVTSQPIKDKDGKLSQIIHNITYYWFVGHDTLTNNHYQRTLLDLQDRVLKGYDQQWAYATVGMNYDPHLADNDADKTPTMEQAPRVVTRAIDGTTADAEGFTEADRIIQEFVIDLAKEVIDPKMIKAWPQPATR